MRHPKIKKLIVISWWLMGKLMDYVGHGGDRNEVTFRILGVCLPGVPGVAGRGATLTPNNPPIPLNLNLELCGGSREVPCHKVSI